jgi:hypothetical protein
LSINGELRVVSFYPLLSKLSPNLEFSSAADFDFFFFFDLLDFCFFEPRHLKITQVSRTKLARTILTSNTNF